MYQSVGRLVGRLVGLSVCLHFFSRTMAVVDTKLGYVGMCNGRSAQQESGAALSTNMQRAYGGRLNVPSTKGKTYARGCLRGSENCCATSSYFSFLTSSWDVLELSPLKGALLL